MIFTWTEWLRLSQSMEYLLLLQDNCLAGYLVMSLVNLALADAFDLTRYSSRQFDKK